MDELLRKFIAWTRLKVRLHVIERFVHCKEREIWWVHLGANVGHEEDGKNANFERPVVIVAKFFGGRVLWVVPLSTSDRIDSDYYFRTNYTDHEGHVINQVAMLPHLRSISSKRLIRKLRVLPKEEFSELKSRLRRFLPE